MIQLETYKGSRTRHTCPQCGRRHEFTRFINTETNEYLPENVGICNRSSSCGYRYTAKQYFADNPTGLPFVKGLAKKGEPTKPKCLRSETRAFDFIATKHLTVTLGDYDQNDLVQFLFNLFPDCADEIQFVLKMYFVGTFEDYTCFPSIDRLNRICRAKLIRFNRANGKRLKGRYDTSSLPAKLKLKEDFRYKQIFFGEHLLSMYPNKPVAIVESEKTAIIASLCMPQFVWLATGSKQWLKTERLERLGQRQIILYPDADGFDLWQDIAVETQNQSLTVNVSSLIENFATDQQKANQYDLADYLIEQQNEINVHNKFVDSYNSKLKTVLNDESLQRDFDTILDEQKAVLIIDGGLADAQAEKLCIQPENIRSIALSL